MTTEYQANVLANPVEQRLPYDGPFGDDNLRTLFAVHHTGGPRAVWFMQHGEIGDKPATRLVEDAAIAFYTAFNARFGTTF